MGVSRNVLYYGRLYVKGTKAERVREFQRVDETVSPNTVTFDMFFFSPVVTIPPGGRLALSLRTESREQPVVAAVGSGSATVEGTWGEHDLLHRLEVA